MAAATETMPRHFSGKLVREARLAKGWSETKLAGEVDCTAQAIKDIEAGKYAPGGVLLARIADALGIASIDSLYERLP